MNDYESIMMLSSLEGGEGMIYTVTLSAVSYTHLWMELQLKKTANM